ncbi:hypothetical protein EJ04DRAFT_559903 [Polyplosphaeria fusca]|uniref:Uncharacterized protein n=1 Tax=Polyplosphaeria fusca TaxID=682080 RepID=A0A9P4R7K4_9PLEO|nr:hypothetical protein EJ04DRAFT_559903 [Polyplosphaeria fusca]
MLTDLETNLFRRAGGGGASTVPYHPPPSVGHEIGVMFGGFGAMILGALLFYLWWRVMLARDLKREEDRVISLKRRGLFDEKRRSSAIEDMNKRRESAAGEVFRH